VKRFFSWWREHGKVWAGLCLLTLLLWQWRFERIGPNLIPDNACESLEHWTEGKSVTPEQIRADGDGLVFTKRRNQPNFSLSRPLEGLEEVSYVAVTCDASWENAVPHAVVRWLQLRVVIAGYDERNRFCAPMDHGVVGASGSKGWHRVQTVVELPVNLKKVVISIDGFGEEGVLRLRGLRVEAVRQRAWFVPATVILLGCWAWVLSRVLLPQIRGRWVQARAFVIACGILAGAWVFVFPQGRTMFPSLIGGFVMGPVMPAVVKEAPVLPPETPDVAKPAPKPVPSPAPDAPRPRLRTIPPSTQTQEMPVQPNVPEIEEVKPVPVPVTAAPQKRKAPSFGLWLRELDRKWNWKKYNLTHFTAFFGIGLFVFGCAGSARIWPLPFGIALLGEIIPNLIYNTWDKGDWWDVASNVGGLLLALGIVLLFQRIRRMVTKRLSARKTASGENAGPDDLEVL
jgi:hypothetical protein